jgi:sugar O-acyltransferase (sialic acid O-acetyltransferase NeuD family)
MRDLLLFPCNGNALEALDCLDRRVRPIAFVDDDPGKVGTRAAGLPVRDRAAFVDHPAALVLAVPGSPTSFPRRSGLIRSLGIDAARFATVIHPTASVSRHARIGANVLIMAGVVITANAVVEDHVVILPNTVVHHDSRIGRGSIVGAGVIVAGAVQIAEDCYISSGSRIRDHVTVARGTLVGLGTVVLRSIEEPGGIWIGTPARRMAAPAAA